MYAGHIGPALAAKGLAPRVPLWVLLVASYAPDAFEYSVELLRGRPPEFVDVYLLPSGLVFAALAGLGYVAWRGDVRAGVVVALTALTHVVLDAFAYGQTLWPGGPGAWIRLQRMPLGWIGLELALIVGGWWLYRQSLDPARRGGPAVWTILLLPVLLSLTFGVFAETVGYWRPDWLPIPP